MLKEKTVTTRIQRRKAERKIKKVLATLTDEQIEAGKGKELKVGFYRISPKDSARYLEHRNRVPKDGIKNYTNRNRRENSKATQNLIKDMAAGNFTPINMIVFDWEGMILDGQHRLFASVKSQRSIECVVVTGANPEHKKKVDRNQVRGIEDVLGFTLWQNWNMPATAWKKAKQLVRGWMAWDGTDYKRNVYSQDTAFNATDEEIEDFCVKNQKAIEWVAGYVPSADLNQLKRQYVGIVLGKMYNIAGEEKTLQFARGLATGSPDGKTCPINKAREILFEVDAEGKPVNTQLRDVRLRHLQQMICVANAYLAGRKIRTIKKEQVMKG